jgi:sugar lactone lactonase YvrE
MRRRQGFFVLVVLLLAMEFAAGPRAAGVEVIAGKREGRSGAEPVEGAINEPFATAFDLEGRLWGVEFTRANRVFRLPAAPAGGTTTPEFVVGKFRRTDGAPAEADTIDREGAVRFNGLHDLAIGPDDTIYLADTFHHRIRALDRVSLRVRTIAGTGESGFSGDGGPGASARFDQPYCVSLVPGGGALLVADIGNARLRSIDLATGVVTTVAGNGVKGPPQEGTLATATPLAGPRAACAAADGTIWLALREGNALVAIRQGRVSVAVNVEGKAGFAGDGGPGVTALLAGPKYVAMDGQGRVLVCDTENHCIRRYDPVTGIIVTVAGVPGSPGTAVGSDWRTTQLARPHAARIDPAGNLVVADSDNDRILAGPLD